MEGFLQLRGRGCLAFRKLGNDKAVVHPFKVTCVHLVVDTYMHVGTWRGISGFIRLVMRVARVLKQKTSYNDWH